MGDEPMPEILDRLSVRERPDGRSIMHQTWGKLLFLHWPVPVEAIRARLPPGLEMDTWEGTAWVGVTPFTMWGVRPPYLPAVPVLSETHELNVRTYVHHDGVPGVWFFSLDASNAVAVQGARLAFHLPYHRAEMRLDEEGDAIRFSSRRTGEGAHAVLEAAWTRGAPRPEAEPGTRDFFLIERYCLYTEHDGSLRRSRIHHRPWSLRDARVDSLATTMLEANRLPTPDVPPLVHAQGRPLEVEVWPLEKLG
jgi:uncharacterized protein